MRKYVGESVRKEPAKERWAEDNARDHFSHDAWLPDTLKKPAEYPGRQENGADRKD